jgi:peptidyl-dipeptidase A
MRHGAVRSLGFLLIGVLIAPLAEEALALPTATAVASPLQERADRFLSVVGSSYQALHIVSAEANWAASTDVSPEHDAAAAAASKALAAFSGNAQLIAEVKALLARESELDELTQRQLKRLLLIAAEGPMTNPALTAARIDAETAQASILNSFVFRLDGEEISANAIDDALIELTDLDQRLAVWEAAKASGPALRPGLVKLQGLRNGVAREMGYPDFFALQAAGHDLSTAEMIALQDDFLAVLRPLYLQLHTWARYELAARHGVPVPERIPAHWLPNRWAQDWSPLAPQPALDLALAGKSAEWVVRTAESFYTGMGREPLPASFWAKSDLYPVAPGETRRKNTHASCWSLDLDRDIRALMSVEADAEWFRTAHHELGHGHYDLAYARPEVPVLLRTGASPAMHEAFAGLGDLASRQRLYLEALALVPAGVGEDPMRTLLREALLDIPFMFWASGTMAHFEAALYAEELPAGEWNARWWQYVGDFQGVAPPAPRGEETCDAATKTHISDAPAYYVSYAIATVIQYQLHEHIARRVLGQDPHACNYAGNKYVGAFLHAMQRHGATRDWRAILREATGEELSTRAMLDYYQPLLGWLEAQNAGRGIGWE